MGLLLQDAAWQGGHLEGGELALHELCPAVRVGRRGLKAVGTVYLHASLRPRLGQRRVLALVHHG